MKPCISLNVGGLLSLAKALRGLCRDNMAAKRQVSRPICCVIKWKPCRAMTNSDQESSVSKYYLHHLAPSNILVLDLLLPRWHLLYHCSHLACSFLAAFSLRGTCADPSASNKPLASTIRKSKQHSFCVSYLASCSASLGQLF